MYTQARIRTGTDNYVIVSINAANFIEAIRQVDRIIYERKKTVYKPTLVEVK